MPKHSRVWNACAYQQYVKEGRGQGTGAGYMPWILVQDFPSRGMVSRVRGSKTGRVHHFMSNLELSFFFLLDWSADVLDIREQYPLLDLRRMIEIAEEAQIRYPYDPQSGFPYVLTSDFYIDTTRGPMVVTIKPAVDLTKPRVREKLEVERRYWDSQNIRWTVVTENEIDQTKAQNIEWLSQASDLTRFGLTEYEQALCIAYFAARYTEDTIGQLIRGVEREFCLPPGMGLNIYKHLAYWKRIDFDASERIDFSAFAEPASRLAA